MFGLQNFGLLGVLGGASVPLLDQAALYMDFTTNTARLSGVSSSAASLLTTARASAAWADNAAGVWSAFGNNVPRITDKGLLIEEARTNVVLWNRDLTNAAWIKTSVTAVKDQAGIDGVAASASKITASGANGTCLQTTAIASSARWQSAFVKRITGAGTVQMTMDNGTTWTTVTVTAGWTRVNIPTQTLANPVVGFRLVTSGDAIAVDVVQNENGAFVTSPIATTTAAVARAADSIDVASFAPTFPASLFGEVVYPVAPGSFPGIFQIHGTSGTTDRAGLYYSGAAILAGASSTVASASQFDNTIPGAVPSNVPAKSAAAFATNDFAVVRDGSAPVVDVSGNVPAPVKIAVGRLNVGTGFANCYLRRAAYWPLRLTNAQLQAITS